MPDELRQSLSRSTNPSPQTSVEGEGSSLEIEENEKEAESRPEHPYDILTRVQIDLEPYVLLLQVRDLCFTWLSDMSTMIIGGRLDPQTFY